MRISSGMRRRESSLVHVPAKAQRVEAPTAVRLATRLPFPWRKAARREAERQVETINLRALIKVNECGSRQSSV
jgi:hypothetical protein